MIYARHKSILIFFTTIFFLFLVGCESKQLAGDLSQRQANEIVNLLFTNNISADLVKSSIGSKSSYSISIRQTDYPSALGLIQKNGLPSADKLSVEDIIKTDSFFPQARELEMLKLERAYASEIEKLIRAYKDVNTVSAVVRKSSVNDHSQNSVASVALVIQSESPNLIDIDAMTSIIMKVVPEVLKANVVISVQAIKSNTALEEGSYKGFTSFLGFARVIESDQKKLSFVVTILLLMFCLAGGIIGYYIGLGQKTKRSTSRTNSERKDLIGLNDTFLT